MRIVIANAQVPFVSGGAEYLAESLRKKLIEYGHKAEMVSIPFKWYPPERIPEHILSCRLLDLTQSSGEDIDMLIGLKFPAYCIGHPNKVLWLFHQFRQVYDLWGTEYQDIPSTPEGIRLREIIIRSDNTFLREAKRICTISGVVSKRLKDYNNLDSTALYPPLNDSGRFYCERFDDYLFYPSRINTVKRQALAIESMKYVRSGARLLIAGRSDNSGFAGHLRDIIKKGDLEGKVELLGEVPQEEKFTLFANALGCLYIPYDEDYGFVTLESFYSKKPVITCTDSGGTLEMVENRVNGSVVPPEPRAIAAAIDELYSNKERARKMGAAGHDKLMSLDITWDRVMETLIG